ncbi:MAG: hypothetical protein WC582_00475 [Patescibacteria group bacterium]
MAGEDKIKLEKMINGEYLETVKNVSQKIIFDNIQNKAFELFKLFKKALRENKDELKKYKEIYDFYNKIIIKFGFIGLPLLDDEDAVDLVGNYFTWQFRLPDYDFLGKFHSKLINTEMLEDRDLLKNKIKKVLLENKEIITSQGDLKTIAEWLRDYNSKLGIGPVDNLKKTQYITNLKSHKGVDDFDVKKLKILFSFYEGLKLSSLTPQGFEEEIPVIVKGKLYIFKQGELEPMEGKIKKSENTKEKPDEWQNLLDQYPVGSLERKAIEEEMEKIKK